MTLGSASHMADTERAELETVVAVLERSPRLAKLLNFVGQKYLDGLADEITEYNIATEVFGRAKTSFDSTDSVARTEMYRLRKKLKEYYEAEGADHPIQILIPFRTYVPEFIRRDSLTPKQQFDIDELRGIPALDLTETGEAQDSARADTTSAGRPLGHRIAGKQALLYGGAAVAALALISLGAVRLLSHGRFADSNARSGADSQAKSLSVTPPNAAQIPLRLLAGYNGGPRIDSAGAYWEADRYFSGEAGFTYPNGRVTRTSDPLIFEHWRTGGNFSYNIPLAPGPYELHLFFVASPADQTTQFFTVEANGQPLLTAFNVSADALGPNIADEKVFRDITPDRDGFLHLKFSGGQGVATLSAIEILPGLPHSLLPIRLVMQSSAVTGHDGNLWHPDDYFQGGASSSPPRQVGGTPDPSLYAQERFGHFTYSIPVDTRDRYTLILHFAELYWLPDPSGSIGAGTRVFNVYCDGSTLLDHLDIYKEVGALHALTKTFYHLRPSSEGKIDLTFEPVKNYATVSAIEVIDESD